MQRRAFLLGLLWLGACSTTAPLPSGSRQYRGNVKLSGRLSVSYQVAGKPQSLQGKFDWTQRGENIDIELFTPLGQTMARIAITPTRARLEQSNGEVSEASSIDLLTEQHLGWALPVDGMRFWLQGFVRDAQRKLITVTPEQVGTLRSDGWRLRYVSWQADQSTTVPKRIDFARDAASSALALKVVVDRWQEAE